MTKANFIFSWSVHTSAVICVMIGPQWIKLGLQLDNVILCLFLRVQSGTKSSITLSQTQQKSLGILTIPGLFQKSGKNSGIFWTHYCLLRTKIWEFKSLNDLWRHKMWRNSLFCPIPDNDYGEPKLAWNFCTSLKRFKTLERRLKNFETLFQTSDLEFVVWLLKTAGFARKRLRIPITNGINEITWVKIPKIGQIRVLA